ncbi:MAG TPA: hypothetical protein VG939_14000 [Caulobacteraceae bacterium]|nr:hypothetical protein [Caulobacteraceae bacterium]
MARSTPIVFEGFPRVLERADLRPGRWFVAAEDGRPVLCLVTDVEEGEDLVTLTFSNSRVEQIDFAPIPLSKIPGPYATVEDEILFTPGLAEPAPLLTAPIRRPFRGGTLLRLRNGDIGVGFATRSHELVTVSLASGHRAEGHDLVFDRWTLSLRRGDRTALVGHFKPLQTLGQRRAAAGGEPTA